MRRVQRINAIKDAHERYMTEDRPVRSRQVLSARNDGFRVELTGRALQLLRDGEPALRVFPNRYSQAICR